MEFLLFGVAAAVTPAALRVMEKHGAIAAQPTSSGVRLCALEVVERIAQQRAKREQQKAPAGERR